MRFTLPLILSLVVFLPVQHLTAQEAKSITVAPDGSGDFSSVQAAIDSLPQQLTGPAIIYIKPGTYKERVLVADGREHLTLRGEGDSPEAVKLTYDLHARSVVAPATQPVGTSGSASTVINADDFTAENITFENPSGEIAQAVAVKTGGGRIIFRNCRFLGGQDTLYANGRRIYFDRCYVEGRVDFIFGRATAVFDHCTIHSKNGGFITAPSTQRESPFGFVFLDCKLTGEGDRAYLGRPWRDYGSSVFIRCELGDHIRPEGFHHWKPEREATARFAEYACTGPGANRAGRVPWSKALTDQEASKFTVENILAGDDNWDPRSK